MSDFNDIARTMKEISEKAMKNGKPVEFQAGTVINENPLKIQSDDKVVHDASLGDLILTHLVRDFEVDISVNHSTEKIENVVDEKYIVPGPADVPLPGMVPLTEHNHTYEGRKKIILHLGLKTGEKVILMREQGGQRCYVLDRVDDPITSGEWL